MEWKYSYVKEYSDPLTQAKRNHKGEVSLDPANLVPKGSKSWHELLAEHKLNPKHSKLIFVTRHARSVHNDKSARYGKALYYEFFARDPADIDPALAPDGKGQALMVGKAMRHANVPLPISYYSSPLRRCVLTAIYASEGLYGSPYAKPIYIKDNLREWLGWNHKHSSDQRGTKSQILSCAASAGGQIISDNSFPERDVMVGASAKETFADVRFRIKRALDDIFDTDDAPVIHLFLHNRCFRSFLCVIGHAIEKEEFDMANGATVAFLVQRQPLTENERRHRRTIEAELRIEEQHAIERAKKDLSDIAQTQVREMSSEQAAEIYEELSTDEDRKKWKMWRASR